MIPGIGYAALDAYFAPRNYYAGREVRAPQRQEAFVRKYPADVISLSPAALRIMEQSERLRIMKSEMME